MIKLSDVKNWTGYWEQLRTALLEPKVDPTLLEASLRDARAKMPVPVIWLLGKTQSGKTSIIRALTGSETAEIGNGFQPCTRSSRFYDFPAETPIVKFSIRRVWAWCVRSGDVILRSTGAFAGGGNEGGGFRSSCDIRRAACDP